MLTVNAASGFGAGGREAPYPYSISNLKGHWRSDLGVTESSSLVSNWADQSDEENDFAEATNKPLIVANIINGKSVIRFDGTNDVLACDLTIETNPIHMFCVVRPRENVNGNGLGISGDDGSGGSFYARGVTGTGWNIRDGNSGSGIGVDMTTDTAYLLTLFLNGASSHIEVNGSKTTGNPGGDCTFDVGLSLGLSKPAGTYAYVEVAEISIYDTAEVSGSDLTTLEAYFNSRYALF